MSTSVRRTIRWVECEYLAPEIKVDPTVAKRMTDDLTGKTVGGWSIGSYLGAGKSALVFECAQGDTIAALKVFDPDLVNRHGKSTQLERIKRELSLVGKRHPNLVQVYDGGECTKTGNLFVAMELIPGGNLEDELLKIPRDRISRILSQVTSAVMFLEEHGLAHRDIKPSNIAITKDFERAVLMDLGVLRPMGESDLTDHDEKVFIGTLRYSSPEFLYRDDVGSPECWRAVSIYQLGGVLHDLIMRKPLFEAFSQPFSMLVDAVKEQIPDIYAVDVSQDLVNLARNSLTKDPKARLRLVSWDDFLLKDTDDKDELEAIRARVAKRKLAIRLNSLSTAVVDESCVIPNQIKHLVQTMENVIHNQCAGQGTFPRMSMISKEANPALVTVNFAQSESHSLKYKLSLSFKCEVVDFASFSVLITASAYLLPDAIEVEAQECIHDVFRGPISSPNLSLKISDYLYVMLDRAQNLAGMTFEQPYCLDETSL